MASFTALYDACVLYPPKTVEEFLEILTQQRLPQTVARFRDLAAIL